MRKLVFGLVAFFGAALIMIALMSGIWSLKDRLSRPPLHQDTSLYRKSDIQGLRHEHVPGASGVVVGIPVTLNSLGFRGPEITPEKPAGMTRIAVLGDSEVFGQGVLDHETLPAVLEGLLNQGGAACRWQVINAGVRQYNTAEEAAYLRARVMLLDPDGVILCITEINDLEVEPFRYTSPELEKAKKSFWWKVGPVRLVMTWRLQGKYLEASRKHIRSLYDPDGKAWKDFVKALEDIKSQCDDSGAWLVAITLPLLEDEDTFRNERRQLHQKLSEMGIEYIDPKPELSKHRWRDLVVSPKDMHPSALALRIYAELVHARLKESGFLDEKR